MVLGLDYGSKRIGVAVGDVGVGHASAVTTIATAEWATELPRLTEEHGADRLVVGLPRGLDGQETAQTALARRFASEAEAATGLPVTLQDEAGTSELAIERLGKLAHDKAKIDAEAAAIILQDYLDLHREAA